MNPLLSEAIGSILRWALSIAAGLLVQQGIWSQAQAQTYVLAASMGALSLGWSLWAKYRARIKFLTALEAPAGATESSVTDKVANGMGAPLAVLCFALLLSGSLGCAARQEPPNLSPVAHAAFVADPYTIALADFQDGVIAGHQAGWLSTKDTRIVLDALQVAFTAISAAAEARRDPQAPGGAKAIAVDALRALAPRVNKRFAPYLADALRTMGGS